ncbi:3-hydroxyisobutyrate dehydrogenase [Paenibacillus sp. UNCCL117]|uniref:NAD(P)-dependent oxidoreductase n=1 Tax=unclassified Paenibacillus TaxID=185978 RepID=UPI000887FAFE|nr:MULTISPECIES: NAD(P)-dependent oxidoreductase [unclassified Paenibacillus]SDD89887.1 3-hydroxyisobutyrate dehydrogenase [Paenibacillus sp. cl123]SFW44050.1 3-hydroxyisobutyrate dehydrogenase [Paenibacillus sp. UNCCL117]
MALQPGSAVGFIGIGVMGKSMAGNLLEAGYKLHVYTRTPEKAEELVSRGAVWHDSPAALAEVCDAVLTMVGYPKDVEEIYLGERGLIAHAKQGAYLIDMTTSSPLLAGRIYEAAAERGLHALDAPVSGGDVGARERRLSIMVGGGEEAFAAVRPLLETMGTNIVLQGEAGAGQHTKMCNQIAIASNMLGVCEALAYAQASGLEPQKVLKSIETGAAGSWSLSNLAPRIIDGNYEPGFYIKHFIKDMGIALEAAKEMKLELPGLALAESIYRRLADQGYAEKGTQALYKAYRE